MEIATKHGFLREEALAHEFLGDLARARGDWEAARREWEAALAIGERIAPRGDVTGEPLRRMAEAALHEANIPEALDFARRAYSVNTSCGDRKERAATFRVLGDIARARGRSLVARRAYEISARELRAMGALGELAESERALSELSELGETAPHYADAPPPDVGGAEHEPPTPPEEDAVAFRLRELAAEFLSQDPVVRHIVERLRVVSRSSGTVLLHGETGTGKELLARLVHEASGRRGSFIAVNASAFPEALVESELFGHIRGAFTGAVGDRKGLLEVAQGGTFFLDEIGELPSVLQSKLLRTLEEKAVRRIGSAELRRVDVRFVVATNRDLREEVDAGRFRTDLYHRIAIHEFEIPPLRRRIEDIPLLARYFLAESLVEWEKGSGGFEAETMEALLAYPWPGNVRELANEMERVASVVADREPIALRHLSGRVRAAWGGAAGEGLFEEMALRERARIEEALEATGGNQSRAGAILGLSRQALRYKILKYGISVHKDPPDRPPLKNSPKG
jgi:DNA-binding NtrC family response regulator